MNIIDAIKSDKKFRRKNTSAWYSPITTPVINISAISVDDFLADDWEVESQPVTITRKDLDKAWAKASSNMMVDIEVLARELGL